MLTRQFTCTCITMCYLSADIFVFCGFQLAIPVVWLSSNPSGCFKILNAGLSLESSEALNCIYTVCPTSTLIDVFPDIRGVSFSIKCKNIYTTWATWADSSSELFYLPVVRLRLSLNFSHFYLLLQNHLLKSISTTLSQSILVWRGFKFVQMKGRVFFQRGRYLLIAKIYWRNLKIKANIDKI